jgi:hypothetical protein
MTSHINALYNHEHKNGCSYGTSSQTNQWEGNTGGRDKLNHTSDAQKDLKTKHNSKSQSGKAIEGIFVFHGYINQGYKAININ